MKVVPNRFEEKDSPFDIFKSTKNEDMRNKARQGETKIMAGDI